MTESEATLLTRCRRMVNSEVLCDITHLAIEVPQLKKFVEASGHSNQYLAVSEWLYMKVYARNQHVLRFSNLYIWARESPIDDVLYKDSVIQDIVEKIMTDYEKL